MKANTFVSGLVLVAGMLAGNAFADDDQQMVVECTTNDNKYLTVALNKHGEELLVAYGADRFKPDNYWIRPTNDMFWSNGDGQDGVKDVELYADFDNEWVTLAVTNTKNDVLVSIRTEDNNQNIKMIDSCKTIDRLSMGDNVVANMIWVSNDGEDM